ncbi:MAG: AmmeMemoRadiSam system protein B [Chlamydiota bacterium]
MRRSIRGAAAGTGCALLVACLACAGEQAGRGKETRGEGVREMKGSIRYPAVAGQFYPGSPDALEKEVRGFLDAAPRKKIEGRVVGLLSPHAGYTYSGATAAYGYSLLKGRGFTRVVVLAPTHRIGFSGAAVTDSAIYRTPLGDVPVDRAACDELAKSPGYVTLPRAHEGEHSLEVQIPFLQETLGAFTLVPVIVGEVEPGDYGKLAAPLKKLLDAKTVIVASSDFTHYGASFGYLPFTNDVKENLRKLDLGAAALVEKRDAAGFAAYVERTGATICGHTPIGIVLEALPREARGELLHYTTSGDLTGDWSHCVSYVSILFTVPGGK